MTLHELGTFEIHYQSRCELVYPPKMSWSRMLTFMFLFFSNGYNCFITKKEHTNNSDLNAVVLLHLHELIMPFILHLHLASAIGICENVTIIFNKSTVLDL